MDIILKLIGKKIKIIGGNYAGRIHIEGEILGFYKDRFQYDYYYLIIFNHNRKNVEYNLHIRSIEKLINKGILPASDIIIGDKIEIELLTK